MADMEVVYHATTLVTDVRERVVTLDMPGQACSW